MEGVGHFFAETFFAPDRAGYVPTIADDRRRKFRQNLSGAAEDAPFAALRAGQIAAITDDRGSGIGCGLQIETE